MDITHTPHPSFRAHNPKGGAAMDLKTRIKGYCVSTTFLPIMHHGGQYETMVFESDGKEINDFADLYCERYGTEDVARTGHIQTVERIKGGWEPQHK